MECFQRRKCSFLPSVLLHKYFGFQAYGLASNHLLCFLWISSISWLPDYYPCQKSIFPSSPILDSNQNPHQQVLIITVWGNCAITPFTLVYLQWYFMKALQKDSSFLRTDIIKPNPGFPSVLKAQGDAHNAYLPPHH